MDGAAYGLGTRSQRFALYAENGVVKSLAVEKPGAFEVSSAEAMLAAVDNLKAAA
jgi:peroxiredoxin